MEVWIGKAYSQHATNSSKVNFVMEKQRLGRPFSSGKLVDLFSFSNIHYPHLYHLVYFLRSVVRHQKENFMLLHTFQPITIQKSSPNCKAVLILAEIFAEGGNQMVSSYQKKLIKEKLWTKIVFNSSCFGLGT